MKTFVKEYVPYIIIILIVVVIRTYIVTPVRVNGTSMNKTLKDKDIMILNKLSDIEKEDIVVISKEWNGTKLIKRIIGMPGDSIKCLDGIIYINGEEYSDPYAYGITSDFDEVKLEEDEYFILGDNRLVSADSRIYGPVKEKYLEGTTNLIIFPFARIGKVK